VRITERDTHAHSERVRNERHTNLVCKREKRETKTHIDSEDRYTHREREKTHTHVVRERKERHTRSVCVRESEEKHSECFICLGSSLTSD
jgi:hypothetical protein